jgi:hypothetical protein
MSQQHAAKDAVIVKHTVCPCSLNTATRSFGTPSWVRIEVEARIYSTNADAAAAGLERERVADGSIELSNSSHTATVPIPWKKQGASPRALGRLSRVFTARKTQTPSFFVLHGSTTQTHRTQARTKKRRRAGAGARKKTPPLCVREGGVALSEPLHACHAPAPAFICSALCPFPALYKLTTLDAEIDQSSSQCRSLFSIFRRRRLGSWLEHVQRGSGRASAAARLVTSLFLHFSFQASFRYVSFYTAPDCLMKCMHGP